MKDRELLEFAAKAADIRTFGVSADDKQSLCIDPVDYVPWNPLTDDGDALRLAVKLGLDLEWRSDDRVAAYRHANANGSCFTAFESSREDRAASTRRAIVRAAAEIGKGMQ